MVCPFCDKHLATLKSENKELNEKKERRINHEKHIDQSFRYGSPKHQNHGRKTQFYYILCTYMHAAFTFANVEMWGGCSAITAEAA